MWTANKIDKVFRSGIVTVAVKFTDDVSKESFVEEYRSPIISGLWPDDVIQSRLDQLNAVDLSKVLLGTTLAKAPTPPPPTQEDLDRANFLNLRATYQQTRDAFKSGMTKLQQSDVDAAYANMKVAYIDAYAPFVVGLF